MLMEFNQFLNESVLFSTFQLIHGFYLWLTTVIVQPMSIMATTIFHLQVKIPKRKMSLVPFSNCEDLSLQHFYNYAPQMYPPKVANAKQYSEEEFSE